MIYLAFCQKWKDGRTGADAGCTLHAVKDFWRQYLIMREWNLSHPSFRDAALEKMGLNEHLVPDGNPYWCRVSGETRKLIEAAMWPEVNKCFRQYGVKFNGHPKKFWGNGRDGLRKKALSKLSPQERKALGLI